MRTRIDDIAREAGVSTATVSRVLNNPEKVKPETRGKVEEVIAKFGYRPNPFARGLMRGKTGTVGILVPFISNPYLVAIVDAIESLLAKRDIRIYLCNTMESAELEARYVDELVRRNVDALIAVETTSINHAGPSNIGKDLPMPVILVNEHLKKDSPHHIVRCAQEPGFLEAVDFLLKGNRRPIDLVIGDDAWSFALKERIFREHAARRGLGEDSYRIVRLSSVNVEDVVRRCADYAKEAMGRSRPPRAFLAGNDLIGVGILQGVLASGARVPADVAVIGVDNSLPSRISVPTLSTVDLREAELGRLVAETCLSILDGTAGGEPIRITIDSIFLNRGTT